jgi:urease accessory protein
MATVALFANDAETRLEAARAAIGDAGGASAWRVGGTGKLLARLIAEDGYALRKRLIPLLELLNGQAGLPKVWNI